MKKATNLSKSPKKMNAQIYITVFLLMLLASCNKVAEVDLAGNWQAIEVTEEGSPLTLEVEQIKMNFHPTYYEYTSTLKYKEAGTYRIQSNLLFTKDTLKKEGLEKAVEISKIGPDSLFFRMNEKGKERVLKMIRVE